MTFEVYMDVIFVWLSMNAMALVSAFAYAAAGINRPGAFAILAAMFFPPIILPLIPPIIRRILGYPRKTNNGELCA